MTDDAAVKAATEALRDLFNLTPENLSEHGGNDETIATVAVEAARPIIEAEIADWLEVKGADLYLLSQLRTRLAAGPSAV